MSPQQRARLDEIVWVDPERMSGTPCFRGTRVPVQSLVDCLESGISIDQYCDEFPTVERAQVVDFLEIAGKTLLEACSAR